MIVIGIAVYPAMKKYCSSNFSFAHDYNENEDRSIAYWIEDTEEVNSSITPLNPDIDIDIINEPSASATLLNSCPGAGGEATFSSSPADADYSSACDIELLSTSVE